MRITNLEVHNYRTLEDIKVEFPLFYSAICGKNDSGKTNLVRAIRQVLGGGERFHFSEEFNVSLKDDFTQWKEKSSDDHNVQFSIGFEINKNRDAGLYQFVSDYLTIEKSPENFNLGIEVTFSSKEPKGNITIDVEKKKYDGLKAQEILKKLQSSKVVLFHNSTTPNRFFFGQKYLGLLEELSDDYRKQADSIKSSFDRAVRKITKIHQKEIEDLLERLGAKYKVGISLPRIDLDFFPYDITLGDSKIDISLSDWGSGTQNRTMILVTLFRAHQISQAGTSASKITPIIVVEEPESFLHPSAQAQFGRVLQDLSEELNVQVIVTTHSPYMLSKDNPTSNILLARKEEKKQLRETFQIETSGEKWMEPFGLALGLKGSDFEPWKDLFFSKDDDIILVEGEIDKEYFQILCSQEDGNCKLVFTGEILPYHGKDNLKNSVLLNFIKNRCKRIFITYDLDAEHEVIDNLKRMGFEKNKQFLSLGVNKPGKMAIEGLIPEDITKIVYANNPSLVEQAMNAPNNDRRSARQRLKRLILEEFKREAPNNPGCLENFKPIINVINKVFK